VQTLAVLNDRGRSVAEVPGGEHLGCDAIVTIDDDIWIPTARPDVITIKNVDSIRAKLIFESADIPVSPEAKERLYQRGVLSLPDFINNDGVICAAVEYHGGTQAFAFETIEEKIRKNTRTVFEATSNPKVRLREGGHRFVARASFRRWLTVVSEPCAHPNALSAN
jgi:glutamate dehydrogenase (NAD(P)+)